MGNPHCIVTDINNNVCILLHCIVLSQISITKEFRLRLNWEVFRSGKQTFTLRWAINQIESFNCKNTTYKQHITTQNSIISKLLPSLSSSWASSWERTKVRYHPHHHHNRHHYHLREFNLLKIAFSKVFRFFLHIEFESDLAGFLETNDFNKVDASCVEAAFLKVIMKMDKETMEK